MKRKIPKTIFLIVPVIFILWLQSSSDRESSDNTDNSVTAGSKLLNELTLPEQFSSIKPKECIESKTFENGISAIICIKPLERDMWVSGTIKKTGAWETETLINVIKVLNSFKNATFLDIGANIGMYTVLVANMGRQVVAVDADPENLAYIRKSLDLQNTTNRVRLFSNAVSDEYLQMFPYSPDKKNSGATLMKTLEEVKAEGLKTIIPPIQSVRLRDILDTIVAKEIILKIDVEGYECKALQEEIILNKIGKFIPYIFMEWGQLKDSKNCKNFSLWVEHFYTGGYVPLDSASMLRVNNTERDKHWDIVWAQSSLL